MNIKGKPYLSVDIMTNKGKRHKGNEGNLDYNSLSKKSFLTAFDKLLKEKKINVSRAKVILYE
ncbi:hypothetical protein ES708_28850 [subsurface metagenome]